MRALVLIGLSMLILIGTAVAGSRSGRHLPAPVFGIAFGALAAMAVLSTAIDLIPDEVEVMWALSVLLVVVVVSAAMWFTSGVRGRGR